MGSVYPTSSPTVNDSGFGKVFRWLDRRYSFEGKRFSRPAIERHIDLVVERIVAVLVDVAHDAER
jgi:hypothetical protein